MTDETKIIRGSGGGSEKAPPPPYRAPDTLHSRSFATIQDVLSEGEIEGFASASKAGLTKGTTEYRNASLKDVFLDDTAILQPNANNSSPATTDFNYQDLIFREKFGTSNQSKMGGLPSESRSPTNVGVTVTNAVPVTRQITNTDVDAVIVTLTWPQLQQAFKDGDLRGLTVEYKIQIQHDSGGFVDKVVSSVSGRTGDAYSRDHRIDLTAGYTTVDIKVLRVTEDRNPNAGLSLADTFQFTRFQEVIDDSNTYPDVAYVGLRMDSKQFNRIPNRIFRLRGIKVRIPGAGASSSGTPTVDNATGRIIYPSGYIFNGVMGAAVYTNCPAMCLLDLLTNTRYGLGNHIEDSNLDLFSFVAASKYANEEVDDGTGSGAKEARFSCNVNIQSPKEAFAAINDIAGAMMCMPIWSAGGITLVQDKPTTASYLFNLANVGEGGFSYSGSSLKTRHSVISVSYFNMDSREVDFEVVEDAAAIAKFGVILKTVKAYACTSRNQAARLGRSILFAEQNQSETVTFTTSIDSGILVRPGSVIEINDPVRAGARRGGRVVSATTTTVTIDAEAQTTLPALNDSPTISVILSDGTVEVGSISDISDTGGVLTVNSVTKPDGTTASAFTSAPSTNSPYLISSTTLKTQLFKVIQVEESNELNYTITALTYVEGKFAFIEDGTALPTRTISILNEPPSPPSSLTVTERTVVINNIARSKLIVDWQPIEGVTQYLVNYKIENGNYVSQVVFSSDFELLDTPPGEYTFQVFSYSNVLRLSTNPAQVTFTAIGKTALPEDVANLTIEPINEQFVRLRFTQAAAVDVLHGGRVYVRHTNQTGGSATFQSAQDVIEAVAGNTTEVIAPALAGTYLLKFQDDGGRFSENAASVNLSLVDLLDSITVKTDREDTDSPTWNNTTSSLFTNTQYNSTQGGLTLTNPAAVITGTYSQATSSTTVTCTISSHGLSVGEILEFTYSTGDAISGKFTIVTVPDANTFTVTAKKALDAGSTHTGNVSVARGLRGTYDFKDTLDLGGVFSLTLKRHFQGVGFYTGDLFDNRTDNIDTWTDFDGTVANDANAKIAVRTTSDDPSGSPTYSDFNDFSNGTFKGRGFQFRIILGTADSAQNMNLQQGGYTATMPSRTEQSSVIASGSAAKAVTFTAPFFVGTSGLGNANSFLPSVNISPQNMASGDYFELSSISGTGFTVHFKNSSNASIDRNFTYSAVGFGKGG